MMNRDTETYRIYILRCPLAKEPRYVGSTTKTLRQRLLGHLSDTNNIKKLEWIRSLEKQNEFPIIELQCQIKGYQNAKTEERNLIIKLSKKYQLFNITYNPALKIERVPARYIVDELPKVKQFN